MPSSVRSLLFKLISEKEHILNKRFNWSVKILEQAGVPLLNKFSYKFSIQDGCPKNESCILCSNDTLKCSTKGIIYKGYCVDCQTHITGDRGYVLDSYIPTYIGESSRPARERISEHIKYLRNWNKESVIIYHWMEDHGTDVVSPNFKFEIICAYTDPLRHQLTEAIQISKQATLNGKYEFGLNEIYSLQCSSSSRDREMELKKELQKRQCYRSKIENFIDVMSNICNNKNQNCRASKKRTREPTTSNYKRLRMMQTSTPRSMGDYRNTQLIEDEGLLTSPIVNTSDFSNDRVEATLSSSHKKRTNVSDTLDKTKLTPDKPLSDSKEELKLARGARDLSRGHKKSSSLPNLSWDNIENSLFKPYPTRERNHLVGLRQRVL